ncbi:MAG: HAMP domain-containing protein [Thiobacillaceae bacterium]|nr:HAMP domain-containing protein [Thiobacillaceae bacterium]MCX7672175.1 HAMP domain-containing protein [Thiobacillaceae bacterium]MDW8324050.1 adenylate/guanylate cyclase domain-containing protein [Burkholderiales bacterium]
MRRPIRLKIFAITLVLLLLMVVVTWLSVMNLRTLHTHVRALSDYYLPLNERVASVEILVRQQLVHAERIIAGLQAARADAEFLARESQAFDLRGINADQVLDASVRLTDEARARPPGEHAAVSLALLARQLTAIQTARQRFHASFREYQLEAEQGNPRSQQVVRAALARAKDAVDVEIGQALETINGLTRDTAARAKREEARAVRLTWIITAIATALGLIFAWAVSRALVEPIRRLLSGTHKVEQGELDVEIQVRTRDELAELAEAFNHMVLGLKEKERIRETFGRYVDPRIVQGLLDNRLPTEGGQQQVMTVFFSDLAGFTRLCEGLTPDATVRLLNRYFGGMAEVIRAQQGIIDKYIGDAVMAFWGPPFTSEQEHARLCCAAALEQQARLQALAHELPAILGVRRGLPQLVARMGIATGEVVMGAIGSPTARGYTVIGDTVNLAARLEQANKLYGSRILVAQATRDRAAEAFVFRELDRLRVAGRSEPEHVYELVGRSGELKADTLARVEAYARGLAAYRAREWDEAEAAFRECLRLDADDQPAAVMLERIAHLRRAPPAADWDGVWDMSAR